MNSLPRSNVRSALWTRYARQGGRVRVYYAALSFITILALGCSARHQPSTGPAVAGASTTTPHGSSPESATGPEAPSADEIEALIEQLVFAEGEATEDPVITPGITAEGELYREQYESCQRAFRRLTELKDRAFPYLIAHLNDRRQSIPFRNHCIGQSVGHACYWCIYFQLQDRPKDYSSYGYVRIGRDGQEHVQPYWDGTPFDDAGGVANWLEQNKHLPYPAMQIECLTWLLSREKAIGARNADSYFQDILPLEIRILERRLELGEDVAQELARLQRTKREKLVDAIPPELLPSN
jgi:hypothetical protein